MIGVMVFALMVLSPKSAFAHSPDLPITEWNIQWIRADDRTATAPPEGGAWLPSGTGRPLTAIPEGAVGAWVRLVIPPTSAWNHPTLLIERLYGLDVSVYEEGRVVYRIKRNFDYERTKLLLPVAAKGDSTDVILRIESKTRAGLVSGARIGEFNAMSERFVRKELPDLLLGASIGFLAMIMILFTGYLSRRQRGPWVALSLIALSTSIILITYSPLPNIYFNEYGRIFQLLFDTSMCVLFPAFCFYVDSVFEGRYAFFTTFGRWLIGYCVCCFAIDVLYQVFGDPVYPIYRLFTGMIFAAWIFVELLMILVLSIMNAVRGNRDSIILSLGFLSLAIAGVADLILLFASHSMHVLFIWKYGVMLLIGSLVMILARRISADYAKLLSYSKELELYNHRLQRTEKMKIISDLAASVAHEVRNPMQVTRGYLQLLSSKTDEETKRQFSMAINELDRASTIITDFLTFAKPELDTIVPLNVKEEIQQIETIMSPLAAMHGGVLIVRIPDGLYINGNSSKFKQAFINMIKNSIEALQSEGIIEIEAFAEGDTAVIRVKDNGEGMDEGQIAKLGEPFFSTKSKGTGLGTMVTFRIIEVMKGTLEYRSTKGKGTEAIVRFPLVSRDQFQ